MIEPAERRAGDVAPYLIMQMVGLDVPSSRIGFGSPIRILKLCRQAYILQMWLMGPTV